MEDADLLAHESMDAAKFKHIKHELRELKEELEMGHEYCNGNDHLTGLAALGLLWDRNRGYDNGCYSDCHNGFDSIRDLQLSQQINDGNRGVTDGVNNMATLLHEVGNHNSLLTTIQSGDAAIQREVLETRHMLGEQSMFLQGELCRVKDGQSNIERDILTGETRTADRFHGLSREVDHLGHGLDRRIDHAERHIAEKLCDVEKTQIRDFAALSRQMQECCCDLKTEGLQNTMRVLDEIRCNREKDLEKEILTLRGEVSQNKQNELLISYLIKSGVVPTC